MNWTTLTDELPISFRTCQGCRERSLSCRTGCAGWQYREAEKQERYRRAQAARSLNRFVLARQVVRAEYVVSPTGPTGYFIRIASAKAAAPLSEKPEKRKG